MFIFKLLTLTAYDAICNWAYKVSKCSLSAEAIVCILINKLLQY